MTTNEPQCGGLAAILWLLEYMSDTTFSRGDIGPKIPLAISELARAEAALSAMGPGPCGKHPIACYSAGTTELEFIDGILIAEVAGELPYCRICTLEADRDKLREAMESIEERTSDNETASYARTALNAAKG